jgi:hypothetical protein
VDATILAVSADGARFSMAIPPGFKGGEPTRREITITGKTDPVCSDVGPGGARPTGTLPRSRPAEGSEDTADELLLAGSEKTDDKEPVDRNPDARKPGDRR